MLKKVIIVTGGNSGVGLECCRSLAKLENTHVIVAGRSQQRLDGAVIEIKKTASSTSTVEAGIVDTSSLKSVRDFAQSLRQRDLQIFSIVCNAGIIAMKKEVSVDGFESTVATNYIGHFLLVKLLLDRTKRVVTVTSESHDPAEKAPTPPPNMSDLNQVATGYAKYDCNEVYATSKLCSILQVQEIAHSYPQTEGLSFTPGFTPDTNIFRGFPRVVAALFKFFAKMIFPLMGLRVNSSEKAGAYLARMASTDSLAADGWRNGDYVSIRPPTKPAVRPRRPVTQWFSGAMTNFKTAITKVFDDAFMPYSSSSVVLTEVEEQWFNQLLSEVDAARARYAFTPVTKPEEDEDDEEDAAVFLGPSDTVVEMIGAYQPLSAEWMAKRKLAPQDDDCVSSTTEATDSDSELDSKCEFDFYDDEDDDDDDEEFYDPVNDEFECCHSCHKMQEREYYADTDDTVTKAERLLRLASSIHEGERVYVDDYLCPCGECPAYKLIESDVEHTVTWRSADERCSIIRVLQAFSTYNEVLGYNIDMIEAAEECLHMWLGDEDQALKSLIMLYDELPQLCASYF
ncbi:hypothetical protein Poli38472_011383 [Pythium oligandrum]|uniref:Uncharacterized protein n=1 Tax=Pythium oligandrum TaxID=41045 RepID=A0A8K1CK91_PYTOL|nr:hypothetical protein Poli38472_011383 [Pythium oligandrum]|eukprot:TMW64503.1 hypothetical protein Poli38472_011383 [Pythium oligandrum]